MSNEHTTKPGESDPSADWMHGIKEPAPPTSPTLDTLWRWRIPIAMTLALACFEALWIRYGPAIATLTAALTPLVLFALPRLYQLTRASPMLSWSILAGSVTTGLCWPWTGPVTAAGVGLLTWLVLATHAWRLKLRHLMVLLVPVAVAIRLGQQFGESLLAVGLLMLPPIGVALVYLLLVRRPSIERDSFIGVLQLNAQARLPLGPGVRAFSSLCSPLTRFGLIRLADRLDRGEPLASALRACPDVLPRDGHSLARLGSATSTLAPALAQAEIVADARRRDPLPLASLIGYPLPVLAGNLAALYFLLTFIQPKVAVILTDYGMSSPFLGMAIARSLGELQILVHLWVGPEEMLNGILIGGGLLLLALLIVQGLRWQGVPVVLPWLWLEEQRDIALAYRGLSVCLDQGLPLDEALANVQQTLPNLRLRSAFGRVLAAHLQGRDWTDALRKNRVVNRAGAAVLHSAQRVGNVPWALRELADTRERRAAHRVRCWRGILEPAALVALGLVVLTLALAYYQPLIHMITTLAEDWS